MRSPASKGHRISATSVATSLTLIILIALALRLGFFWDYQSQNPRQALSTIPFLFEPGNIAFSLAQGKGFASPFHVDTGPTAWMTPVYPLILAGIFRVFGAYTFHTFLAAVLMNILLSAATCVPIFYSGKRIGGIGLAAAAAWLWAIFPNSILLSFESLWDACLSALLAATILWATLALDESGRLREWCAYGVLWGLALMTNATLGSVLPFLLGWLIYRAWKEGRLKLERPAIASAIIVLSCVPWTIRNYVVFHKVIPLRSILGLQLYVGNNPQAQYIWRGDFHPIHDAPERARYIQLGEIAYMQEKKDQAIDFIVHHPAREVQLAWHRFVALWAGGTPTPIWDFVERDSLWFRGVLLFNIFASVCALLGMIRLYRAGSRYWLPAGVFPVVYPVAYYITLALPRYRLPIDPIVLLLAVCAFAPIKSGPEKFAGSRSIGAAR